MTEVLLTIVIVLIVIMLLLTAGLFRAAAGARAEAAASAATISLLNTQLEGIRNAQENSATNLGKDLKQSQGDITKYLQASQETLNKLHKEIGQLQGSSRQMLEIGSEIKKLQDIMKNPKLRGQLGELSLAKLLGEILPSASYSLQHTMPNGKIVDALVKMPDYSVAVDAKFPLPSFEKMLRAETDEERDRQRRQFQRDVAGHIDKIAGDYILPDNGTLDLAMMYIPAENVYYETIINYPTDKTDLLSYALEKKVIPVSPNLLYAYLMTIVMGLKGMQIEKQAAVIRTQLGKLSGQLSDFSNTYSVLGRHLRNAFSQYDEGSKKIEKFAMHLESIDRAAEQGDVELPEGSQS